MPEREDDDDIVVTVYRVHIPAWSTVGYGYGRDQSGHPIEFVGDHRPMRNLGEALSLAEEPLVTSIEPWQVMARPTELPN